MDHLVLTPPIDHHHYYKESYNDEVDLVVDIASDIHIMMIQTMPPMIKKMSMIRIIPL